MRALTNSGIRFQAAVATLIGALARFNKERLRVGLEVCYCSTLGECWTLVAPVGQPERTDETRHCPVASDSTFKQ